MKKVLLSLLAVAALVLSCQNYDDEFAALNTKIASLESQITSLAELRTAVTGVQSSISSLQSAVAAAQAAAEAADNSDAITALATSVAAIAADLVDLQTAIDGATTEADLDALKEELNTTLAALQALIETNSASISSLITANTELQEALKDLGVDVSSILASNATFEGNLTITNDAELAYAKSLGNKVATIKGDVYVKVDAFKHTSGGDGSGLTAAEVNSVISQITYVVGNVKVDTDESLDLSKLAAITGDYIVIGHNVSDDALLSVGGDVHFDHDGAYSSKIQTAGNIFLRAYDDADAAADGSTVAKVGTTSIDFLALTKATGVQTVSASEATAHTSGASVTYGATEADKKIITSPVTASVKIGQAPVVMVESGLTAATTALTTIELHYAADKGATADGLNTNGVDKLASLALKGAKIASAVIKAKQIDGAVTIDVQAATATSNTASIDLSSVLTIKGLLDSDANSNDITALKSVGGITLSEQTTFSAPALTKSTAAINLTESKTFVAGNLARVSADAATAAADAVAAGAAINANKVEGAVSLPKLTKAGAVSFAEATSFSAGLAKIPSLTIKDGTTVAPSSVVLGSLSTHASPVAAGTITDITKVGSLTLNNQDVTFALTSATGATSITYKGKAAADGTAAVNATVSALNPKLKTLVLGGVLNTVSVTTGTTTKADVTNELTALTSITTEGTIVSFTVNQVFSLTSLTMNHTDDAKSVGAAEIVITNNHSLASVKTSVATVKTLTVTGNGKLGTLDFTSLTKVPNNFVVNDANKGVVAITITGNYTDHSLQAAVDRGYVTAVTTGVKTHSKWSGLKGTYSAATSSSDEVYGQSGLASLKTFINAVKVAHTKLDGTIDATNKVTIALDYIAANADPAAASALNNDLTGDDAAAYLRYANMQ